MLAQVSLTPTESKKLIAKAIVKMDIVQRALDGSTVVLHPSSSTYFIVEEVTGHKPQTEAWVFGVIVPKGACREMGSMLGLYSKDSERGQEGSLGKPQPRRLPDDFRHSWVLRDGKLSTGIRLGSILEGLGPKDVYVKGVNALDIHGNVGVLMGNPVQGGTIGRVRMASKKKGFSIIFPVGLEKLIPIPIQESSKNALRRGYDYSMGMPCALVPVKGITVTELDAIDILSGARAIPIGAGGLGGAEGAVTLIITGDKDQVTQAIEYVEQSKGAKLPPVRTPMDCHKCPVNHCPFPLDDKHWVE